MPHRFGLPAAGRFQGVGDRRLVAVRSLGWREVPVTIVNLDDAADVLRAELDENTCRRALTPYEASRARERRAAVLAPQAAARERAGVKQQPSGNLPEGSRTARETRNVAALGTGYSGSTLDKVDRIRHAAEPESRRRHHGMRPTAADTALQ